MPGFCECQSYNLNLEVTSQYCYKITTMIQIENWNTSCYQNQQLKAFISIAAQNHQQGEFYSVILVNEESKKEIFHMDFDNLIGAAQHINKAYKSWDFIDMAEKQSGSCGSCTAH